MTSHDSLPPTYFEEMFRGDADPWQFETSPYEAAKYDATLSALEGRHYQSAFEVGCANGVLTKRLAPLCKRLLAIDISTTALASARERCASLRDIEFREMQFPAQSPTGSFDLIVMSEVVYYWSADDIGRAAAVIAQALAPGGDLLLVHWIGETDYPQTGDGAVQLFRERLRPLTEIRAARTDRYRLDLWRQLPAA